MRVCATQRMSGLLGLADPPRPFSTDGLNSKQYAQFTSHSALGQALGPWADTSPPSTGQWRDTRRQVLSSCISLASAQLCPQASLLRREMETRGQLVLSSGGKGTASGPLEALPSWAWPCRKPWGSTVRSRSPSEERQVRAAARGECLAPWAPPRRCQVLGKGQAGRL